MDGHLGESIVEPRISKDICGDGFLARLICGCNITYSMDSNFCRSCGQRISRGNDTYRHVVSKRAEPDKGEDQ